MMRKRFLDPFAKIVRPRRKLRYPVHRAAFVWLVLCGYFSIQQAAAQQLRFEPSCDTVKDDSGNTLRSLVTQAFADGKLLVDAAHQYLTDPDSPHSAYERWFGLWNWSNTMWQPGDVRRVVTQKVQLVRGAMMRWSFVFDCTDPKNRCLRSDGTPAAHAYTDQGQQDDPMKIWICPSFAKLPKETNSRDSQAGNVVHEVAHLCSNRQFNDQGACLAEPLEPDRDAEQIQKTAATSPGQVVDNVYAYQFFFAEFGTGCSCSTSGGRGGGPGLVPFLAVALLLLRRRKSR